MGGQHRQRHFAAVTTTPSIAAATTNTLTITDPASAMNGYQYEAVFTNGASVRRPLGG